MSFTPEPRALSVPQVSQHLFVLVGGCGQQGVGLVVFVDVVVVVLGLQAQRHTHVHVHLIRNIRHNRQMALLHSQDQRSHVAVGVDAHETGRQFHGRQPLPFETADVIVLHRLTELLQVAVFRALEQLVDVHPFEISLIPVARFALTHFLIGLLQFKLHFIIIGDPLHELVEPVQVLDPSVLDHIELVQRQIRFLQVEHCHRGVRTLSQLSPQTIPDFRLSFSQLLAQQGAH